MSTKFNYNIIGGFSKLISNSQRHLKYNELLSYVDLDYFNGNSYLKVGFILSGITKPSYFWTKGQQRYNRTKFMKHKLVKQGYDKTKTESEIMYELGYNKIYNCGNLIMKYNKI